MSCHNVNRYRAQSVVVNSSACQKWVPGFRKCPVPILNLFSRSKLRPCTQEACAVPSSSSDGPRMYDSVQFYFAIVLNCGKTMLWEDQTVPVCRPAEGPTSRLRYIWRMVSQSIAMHVSYALRLWQKAWRSMDKTTLSIGHWRLELPRLHTAGPRSVFGYLVLGACVIAVLFALMDQARALTNAIIRWQLNR